MLALKTCWAIAGCGIHSRCPGRSGSEITDLERKPRNGEEYKSGLREKTVDIVLRGRQGRGTYELGLSKAEEFRGRF